MAADKRNALVVVALVAAMTLGGQLLLWLEPGKPRWEADAALIASRETPIDEVTIALVDRTSADSALQSARPESICVVYPDAVPQYAEAGSHLLVLVVQGDDEQLAVDQKKHLLGALGSVLQRGRGAAVRLDAASDPTLTQGVPNQARDLRELLVRKEILTQN